MLQRAAARGDAHSQYLLGVAYFNGYVVPKDWFRAYRLMTAAAASGLPQARDALNAMDARIPLADRQRALASVDKPPARRAIDESAASSRAATAAPPRSEEHTSELQSLMRISYAVFCLKKKQKKPNQRTTPNNIQH